MPSAPQFILASGSPRRKQLLGDLGLSFDIQPADIDETPLKNEGAKDYVLRLSIEKAQAVAAQNAGQIVLAADTTVAVGRRILGKAENTEEATAMLRLMSGRRHRVYTAVAVIDKEGNVRTRISDTAVKMRPLNNKEIQNYAAKKENWQGLAGAYGIQTSVGGALVKGVNGSVSGVVGLPLAETVHLLRGVGIEL